MSKTIIVPVSGGKDSQVCLSLALKTGRPLVCVHQNTGFDHPNTYAQLEAMEVFYKVKIEHTVSKFNGMIGFLEHAKYFPNSSARGCTERLKQQPFAKWLIDKGFTKDNCEIWFGMRSDESKVRSDKYGGIADDDLFTLGDVASFYNGGKFKAIGEIPCRLPIVSWNTEQIFKYIEQEQAPLNPLYGRGHHRVGCYPCLLSRKAEWQAAGRDPAGRRHLESMIALEDQWKAEGNPRKFIKVHRVWDVRDFLAGNDVRELFNEECGYCSI
jgi:3'-phosphoadenosine 5'-phosphosulfate sulfotransferase (PAPS reductase)/FAD synthetase